MEKCRKVNLCNRYFGCQSVDKPDAYLDCYFYNKYYYQRDHKWVDYQGLYTHMYYIYVRWNKMNLIVDEISYRYGYISVVDLDSNKIYFTQGDEGRADIDFITKHGESNFLNYLAGSGYF